MLGWDLVISLPVTHMRFYAWLSICINTFLRKTQLVQTNENCFVLLIKSLEVGRLTSILDLLRWEDKPLIWVTAFTGILFKRHKGHERSWKKLALFVCLVLHSLESIFLQRYWNLLLWDASLCRKPAKALVIWIEPLQDFGRSLDRQTHWTRCKSGKKTGIIIMIYKQCKEDRVLCETTKINIWIK